MPFDFEENHRRIRRQGRWIMWAAQGVMLATLAGVIAVIRLSPEGLGALVGRFLRAAGF